MADDQPIDRTKVTFSQVEGLEPLPAPLELGELSAEVRSLLWRPIFEEMEKCTYHDSMSYGGPPPIGDYWERILYDWHVEILHKAADEFDNTAKQQIHNVKTIILHFPYNKLIDFLQFVLRHKKCYYYFRGQVRYALREGRAAYTVVDDGPTILSAATPEQGAAIHQAFDTLEKAGFDGARAHLRVSGEAINAGDYAGSVRDSIHAVESVAKLLDDSASSTLGPALQTLSKKVEIHSALKEGFQKIYGYTSDEKGIRHALHEDGAADVDMDDAVFMIGACASFVTYLVGKARQAGLIDE